MPTIQDETSVNSNPAAQQSNFSNLPLPMTITILVAGAITVLYLMVASSSTASMENWPILVIGLLYFLPAFVAHKRGHKQASAICILNLFLGWTLIGWVAALVWAATK